MTRKDREIARATLDDAGPSASLRASALTVLSLVFSAAVTSYFLTSSYLSLDHDAIAAATLLLLVIFLLVVQGLRHHRFERFGFANTVTAIRAALVCMVAAAVFCASLTQGAGTRLMFVAMLAFVLDALDGYLARRYRQESPLGARFDMEIDALLILCLSAAVYLLDKAGPWVLLIGLMRYGFVLAQYVAPVLAGPLVPSFRRKLVCVVQVAILCLVLLPQVVPPSSVWLTLGALALLAYSFAADAVYLMRRGAVSS
jgi:phosphatidylglycerophosphate synthase